jgi:hypothetical protein
VAGARSFYSEVRHKKERVCLSLVCKVKPLPLFLGAVRKFDIASLSLIRRCHSLSLLSNVHFTTKASSLCACARARISLVTKNCADATI